MGIYIVFYGIITALFVLMYKYHFTISRRGGFPDNQRGLNKRQRKCYMMIVATLLIFIIGFRSEYQGMDLYNSLGTGYFFYYHRINGDSLVEIAQNFGKQKYANFEIGFVLFCKLLGTICGNHQILLFATALLSIAPVCYCIYQNSSNVWLSTVLYLALPLFATVHFSAIRQGIAIGIAIYSWKYIRERKMGRFILAIMLACTFHSTAIVAAVSYPIYHIKLKKSSALFGGVGILALIYLLKIPLFWILARVVHSSPKMYRTDAINLFLFLTGIYCICVAFCREDDEENRRCLNILWLACAAQAFGGVHNLASRITWYFMPILIIIVPNLLEKACIKEKYVMKVASCIIGVGAVMMGLYYLKNNSMAMAYPYKLFCM